MYTNYLKIAYRNIYSDKLYAGLNILGLGIGLACCLITILFVRHELSYDEGFINSDRVYRVHYGRSYSNGDGGLYSTTSSLAGPMLKQDFPEIEEVARMSARPSLLTYSELSVNEENIYFADNEIFELFDLQWLAGDSSQALQDLSSIVLTETLATRYFGNEEALGKTITLDNTYSLTVTGVVRDLPGNTHLDFNALIPFDLLKTIFLAERNFNIDTWRYIGSLTYVMLEQGKTIESIQDRLPDFTFRHIPQVEDSEVTMKMIPLTDIYMKSVDRDGSTQGSMLQVMSFAAIALGILLIAIINYINISTARSLRRAREIGVRKINGASRIEIIKQFLVETYIVVIVAVLVGVAITQSLLPVVNSIIGKELALNFLSEPFALMALIVLSIALGLAAGSYPAMVLSAYRPVSILKGQISKGKKGKWFRNVLVVMQFSIAIVLIVCISVVFAQMQYTKNFDPGFTSERIVNFTFPTSEDFNLDSQWEALRNQLLSYPDIQQVAFSTNSLTLRVGDSHQDFIIRGISEPVQLAVVGISPSFLGLYEIEFLAGRDISEEYAFDKLRSLVSDDTDSVKGNVILNEAAAREFGWSPSEAINQILDVGSIGSGIQVEIVGVVANTIATVKDERLPLIYWNPPAYSSRFTGGIASVKIAEDGVVQTLDYIDDTWQRFIPETPINKWLLEDEIESFYLAEQQQMRMFSYSAAIAIVIACLGLFGLATYNTARRKKEIGVRKVLGSSAWHIVFLLTNDFSKLVLISNILAWPFANFAMQGWLERFAYRIDLSPVFFIGGGLIALCIAWVTVGAIAANAASAKPVLALRYE